MQVMWPLLIHMFLPHKEQEDLEMSRSSDKLDSYTSTICFRKFPQNMLVNASDVLKSKLLSDPEADTNY